MIFCKIILELTSIAFAICRRMQLGPGHTQWEESAQEHDCQESGVTGDH